MRIQDRKRAFLPKVKTGCLTCKTRKVKCDEAKPRCLRCTSTGRDCGGYKTSPSPSPDPQIESGVSTWLSSDLEKRSFDFYLHGASKHIGGNFDSDFWSREVLQAALAYPAVRHLVVALGSAYENFEDSNASGVVFSEIGMNFAVQQSNLAIRQLTASTPQHTTSAEGLGCILTASILLATFASIQGHYKQSIQHVRSGLRILTGQKDTSLGTDFPIPLVRLRSLLISLYAQARGIINDEAQTEWEQCDPLVSDVEPVSYFANLAHAQGHVEALYRNILALYQHAALATPATLEDMDKILLRQKTLQTALTASCSALDSLEARGGANTTGPPLLILRLYQLVLSIRLQTNPLPDSSYEIWYDGFEPEFQKMLNLCRQVLNWGGPEEKRTDKASRPVYTSGLGIVLPLHMIAARCRNPTLRAEAIALLQSARRREGLWDSSLTSRVVATTIELEQRSKSALFEGVGSPPPRSLDVPIRERIREVKVLFDGDRAARVLYLGPDWVVNRENNMVQRRLEW